MPTNITEYQRKYYQEHKKHLKEIKNTWLKKHPDYPKLSMRKYHRKLRLGVRLGVLQFLGGKCVRCGFDDVRALQIDHINGGGNKEVKLINNTKTYYLKVLNDKEGKYQLLCANCNWIKKSENDEN